VRASSTPAIVLRTRDYGESDKIVTLLTRDAGKLSGIAKGGKRSQRRFAGALGLFAHVTLDYRQRAGAELVFLERAVLLRPWRSIVDSLEGYAAASHIVELADKLTVEQEVGAELYALVLAALAHVDARPPGPSVLRLFELAALVACGVGPDFKRCAACRRPIGEERVRVLPASGGVVCSRCAAAEGAVLSLSPAGLRGLLLLAGDVTRGFPSGGRGSFRPELAFAGDAAREELPLGVGREVAAALGSLLAPHLRGRLRALELLGPILEGRFSARLED
jgi:DNA repair protein RecO (recombination protein O)